MAGREESYRILELEPGASEEEVRRAYRELTKVWHPDRFGHDETLRRRAEEKLKAINEAYQAISAGGFRSTRQPGGEAGGASRGASGWKVRDQKRERDARGLDEILEWVALGFVTADDEIYHPGAGRWIRAGELRESRWVLNRMAAKRLRVWAAFLIVAALFLLLRRPSTGGAIIAAILLSVAIVLWLMARYQER